LGAGNWAFAVAGVPLPDRSRAPVATINAVDAGYFKTLGIPLLRGRAIEPSDDARSPKAVVIDELLATRVFGDQDPIGRGLVPLHLTDTLRVVGVVGTVKQRGLAAQDVPMMYLSLAQWPENEVVVAVRGSGSPASLAPLVRRVVRSLDSTAPVSGVSVLSERMIQTVSLTRFATFLSSLFAAIAVLLGSVGVYAVLAFGVAQRRREIAIRLALGAQRSLVMREVIFKALGITGSGAVVGLVAARLGVGILASLLAGANPHDGRIFGMAAALMIGVGLLGALVPAMRSTMIDLAGELRSS
jgi:ABC-type antimicrobial peptide transport system permease subunit